MTRHDDVQDVGYRVGVELARHTRAWNANISVEIFCNFPFILFCISSDIVYIKTVGRLGQRMRLNPNTTPLCLSSPRP